MAESPKIDKEKRWEQVQIKAFTAWINSVLEKRNFKIENIQCDFNNGIMLIHFLELLSGQVVKKRVIQKPKNRIDNVNNLTIAFNFLDDVVKVKTFGVGVEDFLDENMKMILGFFWTMYKKYRIAVIQEEDKSSEEGLLLWAKKQTDGYDGVNIESYKHGFKNGKAFLALIDKYTGNKEEFDYDSENTDSSEKNLERAFAFAEEHMGIPRLLDVEETASTQVDERSLVLYISLYFHAFVAKMQQAGINAEKDKLKGEMASLQDSLEDRAKRAEALEKELAELQEKYRLEQVLVKEMKEKEGYLEEKVEVLQGLLEQENEEKEELREELENKLTTEVEALKAAHSAASDNSAAEIKNRDEEIEALKAQLGELEKDVAGLQGTVAELEDNLKAEKEAHEKSKALFAKTEGRNLDGLGVLQKNLEQHMEDLHRWQKYLEVDTFGDVDVSGDIRAKVLMEITSENYDDQLATLAKKLDSENVDLEKLLKQKEMEKKQKRAQEKKKKERQKKQEE